MSTKKNKPRNTQKFKYFYIGINAFIIFTLIQASSHLIAAEITLRDTKAQIYFSPQGGATEAIVDKLIKARTEILVQAYSFTSKEIAVALIDAYKRGVHVEIVLDKSNKTGKYSEATFISNVGILINIDSRHAIAHNKVMIIDSVIVITGSFNYTKAAEDKNAENLLIISSKELAQIYKANWAHHKAHSNQNKER